MSARVTTSPFQTSLDIDLILDELVAVFRTDRSGGCLNILSRNRIGNIRRGNSQRGHAQGVQPDSHGIFFGSHQLRTGDAVDTSDGIHHRCLDISVERESVHTLAVRQERDEKQNIARTLAHRNADFHDVFRQFRLGALDRILHVDHRNIRVDTGFEGNRALIVAAVV